MNEFDAVVVGGGVAGGCAAIALAKRGADVALLEAGALPRHKVCGEFLSPEIRGVLARLGVAERLLAAGAREVFQARLIAPNGTLALDLPSPALALSRFVLDEILWRAAREAGAQCCAETRVRAVTQNGAFHVATARGDFRAVGVIEAGGRVGQSKRPAEKYLGLKTHLRGVRLESGVTELHAFNGGYCGLVRVEGDLTNACLLTTYEAWRQSGARTASEFFNCVVQRCPALARRVADAPTVRRWLATGNVQCGGAQPALGGILRCGDAAGFMPPFSGDGMAMAARSGELAGVTLAARLAHGDAAEIYAAAWRREFEGRMRWAVALQPLFMQPLLSRGALFCAARVPPIARFLLAKTRG